MHVARILERVNEVRQNERKARVARAALVSFAAVFVAALSHVIAGGNVPALVSFVGATILALPLTLICTKKRFGTAGMFVAVSLTQAIFHWLFVYLGVSNASPGEPLPAHAEHFGMVQNFVPMVPDAAGADIAMWLSHGVAAVITVWLIRHGDVALERLARVLTRVFWPVTQVEAEHRPTGRIAPTMLQPIRALASRPEFPISHRGPPAFMALATMNS